VWSRPSPCSWTTARHPDDGDPALASATDGGTVRNGLNWNVGSMPFMQNLPDDAARYVNEVRIDSDEGRLGYYPMFN
jgi:hypothetical protein